LPSTTKKAAPVTLELVQLPLDKLYVEDGFNPRAGMDDAALDALGDSLVERGMLNPILALPDGKVVGGHRRLAAAKRKGGIATVPVLVRKGQTGPGQDLVDAVVDNAHRVDLNPLEEALAFARLRADGLTDDAIAKSLSIAKRRVTERLRILSLPANGQAAVASGAIGLGQVAELAAIAEAHQGLCEALIAKSLTEKRALWATSYEIGSAASDLGLIDPTHIDTGSKHFRLNTEQLRAQVADLNKWRQDYSIQHTSREAFNRAAKGLGEWSYSGSITLDDTLIKQAVAGGFAIEVAGGTDFRGERYKLVYATDQAWVQEQAAALIAKGYPAAKKAAQKVKGGVAGAAASDSATEKAQADADKAERRREREAKERARLDAIEFNSRLGRSLMDSFAVAQISPDVLRWLCVGLLHDHSDSGYSMTTDYDVAELAADGLRFVLPGWETRTESKAGKVKVEYSTSKKELAEAFWRWFDEAKTPEEMVGRTLIAFAAARHAKREASMSKDVVYTHGWPRSRGDAFAKLLDKIVAPKLPPGAKVRRTPKDPVAASKPGAALADVLDDVDAGEEVTDEQLDKRADALDENEVKVLRALTDPKRGSGNDLGEQWSKLAQAAGLTQAATKEAYKELVRLDYADASLWVGVRTLGRLLVKRLDEPKGDVASKAKRAKATVDKTGVSTAAQRKVIAAQAGREEGEVVTVSAGDGFPSSRVARLLPTVHPDNPDGLAEVYYPDSRAKAWVARTRIVRTEASDDA
jgi:ParB/RepB/Spo0J family partition protein